MSLRVPAWLALAAAAAMASGAHAAGPAIWTDLCDPEHPGARRLLPLGGEGEHERPTGACHAVCLTACRGNRKAGLPDV